MIRIHKFDYIFILFPSKFLYFNFVCPMVLGNMVHTKILVKNEIFVFFHTILDPATYPGDEYLLKYINARNALNLLFVCTRNFIFFGITLRLINSHNSRICPIIICYVFLQTVLKNSDFILKSVFFISQATLHYMQN